MKENIRIKILLSCINAILVITSLALVVHPQLFAQLKVTSNKVTTRVGNPTSGPIGDTVPCPLIGGHVTCGPSKPTDTCSEYGCGHCGSCYSWGPWCASDPGSHFAADISGVGLQDAYLPSIYFPDSRESHNISCELAGISTGLSSGQDIYVFSCRDDTTGEFIYIDYHHMYPGSRPTSGTQYKTGDVIGKLDPNDGPHAHVQIGIGGGCGAGNTSGCVPADDYLQCK